jgi:hypothetical protein
MEEKEEGNKREIIIIIINVLYWWSNDNFAYRKTFFLMSIQQKTNVKCWNKMHGVLCVPEIFLVCQTVKLFIEKSQIFKIIILVK